jgi:hypothetical protein
LWLVKSAPPTSVDGNTVVGLFISSYAALQPTGCGKVWPAALAVGFKVLITPSVVICQSVSIGEHKHTPINADGEGLGRHCVSATAAVFPCSTAAYSC